MANYLKIEDINKVHPKFRNTVKKSLECGNKVPYGVIYLNPNISKVDIEKTNKFAEKYKW